jgi:hypothetical protein
VVNPRIVRKITQVLTFLINNQKHAAQGKILFHSFFFAKEGKKHAILIRNTKRSTPRYFSDD